MRCLVDDGESEVCVDVCSGLRSCRNGVALLRMVLSAGDCIITSCRFSSAPRVGHPLGAGGVFERDSPFVPRQLYLPVGVNQFCRFTSLAWPRCWAALVR